MINLDFKSENEFNDFEKKIISDKYSYNDFKQELASYYKSKRRQKTFIRRFDDYMGNRNALKDYIKEEVFGMFIFSLIFLIAGGLVYLSKPYVAMLNESYANITTFIFVILFLLGFLFMLGLTLSNLLRIMIHKNIYGILFGNNFTKLMHHKLQYTFVLKDNEIVIPIYYSININKTSFDKIIIDDKKIIDDTEIDPYIEQYHNRNFFFIEFMHNVLIEKQKIEFETMYSDLNAYKLLKKTKQW